MAPGQEEPAGFSTDHGYSKVAQAEYDDSSAKKRPMSTAMTSEKESMMRNPIAYPKVRKMTGQRPSKWSSIRFSMPILVIAVHVALLIFLYAFFIITSYNPVPLPESAALYAKMHQQVVILVVSIIGTAIGLLSTSFMASAIYYSLNRFLTGPNPVPLWNLNAALTLSNESFILSWQRWGWSLASILLYICITLQTASWTTLLSPKDVPVKAGLSGFELDLTSEEFRRLMQANQQVVTPELFANSLSLIAQAGSTAASTKFSLPSILNFNQLSYINSTGGTLPATWTPWISTTTSSSGDSIPPSIRITDLNSNVNARRRGLFPVSFNLTQQGFTSRVECRPVSLTGTTRPSAVVSSLNRSDPTVALDLAAGSITVGCTGDGYTTLKYDGTSNGTTGEVVRSNVVLTNAAGDGVFAAPCGVDDGNGGVYWDIIIAGAGKYSFMNSTICSVWPTTTFVDVHYQDTSALFNSSFPSLINGTRSWREKPAPWLGSFATDLFIRGVVEQGQSTRGSAVGDVIRSFVGPPDAAQLDSTLVPQVLEAYIRGVLEFSLTLLRSAYSTSNSRLVPNSGGQLPENLRVPLNGTYETATVGWSQDIDPGAAAATLVAPTIISLTSILIVLVTMFCTSRAGWKAAMARIPKSEADERANGWFNPGDLLHIIAASRAGGLSEVPFPEYDDDLEGWSSSVNLRFAKVGEGSGLVEAH
ncbi:hypothetical protein EST38_g1917 [Candolleomyces aberdarensis]|uniref:Transmembrane protein n=1 Tax=Candolleomyces aberdarensis TaxID=2316362 RepID=A0A4Q2DWY4_9AGAR|nr:hypothetical protein EST38_g1917 [Candolleomyces aberdarensis]